MAATLSRDPYKAFRFRVEVSEDGSSFKEVAGFSTVSALTQTTEVIEFRTGNDFLAMRKTPGQTNYEPVTLEKGLTKDGDFFHDWAQKLDPNNAENGEYEDNARKDVKITLCDENGKRGLSFTLVNCWVSEYTAMPDLDAGDNSVAVESVTLEHEGWSEDDGNFADVNAV